MTPDAVVIPLWGKLVILSLAKKATLLTAGYLYGFPRLYRRSQKIVRWLAKDPQTRANLHKSVEAGFRLPAKLLHLGQNPKTLPSPALSYLQRLPNRLLPSQRHTIPSRVTPHQPRFPRLKRLTTSFASSPFVARQSQAWVTRREQLADFRIRYSSHNNLQAMRSGASSLLTSLSSKPFALVPAIGAAS